MKSKSTIFFIAAILLLHTVAAQDLHLVRKGVVDLRSNFFSQQQFQLKGEWLIYPQQFISPQPPLPAGNQTYIQFPALWNKVKTLDGRQLPDTGFVSYALQMLLPPQHGKLAFTLPDFYENYSLYVNGRLLSKVGQPGVSSRQSKPFWLTQTVTFDTDADTLWVVLHLSNFYMAQGGAVKSILLGPADTMVLQSNRRMALDFFLCGCLLMGGLFFLGLFLTSKQDKAILYFSLFCILHANRFIGTYDYALHAIWPNINWLVSYKMEYILFFASTVMFALYLYYLFREHVSKRWLYFIGIVNAVMTLTILVAPPRYYAGVNVFYLFMLLVALGYCVYIFTLAALANRTGARYGLLAILVGGVAFATTILHSFGIIPELKLLHAICYISFFFLQSMVISQRFAYFFKKAKEDAEAGLQAKSRFLSTMSHEIRTPLNAVIGISEIMQQKQADGTLRDPAENVSLLNFAAKNLLAVVNDVLDYSKLEANKLEFETIPFDIKEVVEKVSGMSMHEAVKKNLLLHVDVDDRIPSLVLGDPTRLTQVLNNLICNAIKFTQAGRIDVSVLLVQATAQTVQVQFNVRDTGIGISDEQLSSIFKPFAQADSSISRNFGGTGLGLTICNELLNKQGSRLEVDSHYQKGSRFFFTQTFQIAATAENKEAAVVSGNDNGNQLNGVSVLLVEDNGMNAKIAVTFLHNWGIKVDLAENGKEALNVFDPARHQLILMDLQMPVMDGLKATAELRRRGVTCPIIALTANMISEVGSDVAAAGMNGIVTKPFKPQELKAMLLKYTLL